MVIAEAAPARRTSLGGGEGALRIPTSSSSFAPYSSSSASAAKLYASSDDVGNRRRSSYPAARSKPAWNSEIKVGM